MGSGDSVPKYTTYSGGLGGWPLPTMADGNALRITRTKAFSAVEGQKTLKKRLLKNLLFGALTGTEPVYTNFLSSTLKQKRLEALFEDFQPSRTARVT